MSTSTKVKPKKKAREKLKSTMHFNGKTATTDAEKKKLVEECITANAEAAPPKNKDAFYIPAETLPVVIAAAGGRDPRATIKSVHAYANAGVHIIEAASGIILLRATWQDEAFAALDIDTIIPKAAWEDMAAASGGSRELAKTNSKGRSAVFITGPEANHKIDFLPVKGNYPQINKLLPAPWGDKKPPAYNETRIDPKRMEKLMRAFNKIGAENIVMHLSENPNDPIVFTAEVQPIEFVAVIMPLRSPEETERPIDEDGDTIPPPPEKGEADEDATTPPLFDENGDPAGEIG